MRPLFIVGPTATGKSDLAFRAAGEMNTDVISADSMQIYRGMDIGTAKSMPPKSIKLYMVDIADPQEPYSAGRYQEEALTCAYKMDAEQKTPIFAGGTGLYINSLIYPLDFSNTAEDTAIRERLRAEYIENGGRAMLAKLAEVDKISAERLHENDERRIIRALEIYEISKSPKDSGFYEKQPRFDYVAVGLILERSMLYDNINRRVDTMRDKGLAEEVSALIDRGLTFDNRSMQAIGYKEFRAYYENQCGIDKVYEEIKQHTRNYAKRQITWFKKLKGIKWFDAQNEKDEALNYLLSEYKA